MIGKQLLKWAAIASLLVASSAQAAFKSIEEFTQGMLSVDGYFDFYYDKDAGSLYLKVDKEKQPFLFQSSLPNGLGSNDIGLDRGQLGETRIVQFERHGDKVLLVQLNTQYRAKSDNSAEQKSVEQAFAKSVIQGFSIKAKHRNELLIDYTNFLTSDIHGVTRRLNSSKQGSYKLDKSRSAVFLNRSKGFPKNTELEAIVSFTGSKPGQYVRQVAPDPYALTVHMHHSLIELPDDNYKPRVFHPFSGYWSVEHKDYAVGLDDDMAIKYIPRHRLQKKNPNAERSEAVEPIVYYLDPGAPEPVRTALLDGAKWWNEAFEEAGFINAFQVKMLPPHADPMDVRYNTIQWVHRATRGWSYGYSVIDPRSGEILKGHVTLGSLRVRQDYLIAQGLTAPFDSDKPDTSKIKEMALARIRQLSAHEIGHTLGIAHNFSASVNDRASVMDYPHPLVKINGGKIDLSDAYDDKIGAWDKHVVKYGYSEFSGNEQAALDAIISEAHDAGLLYMSDSDARPLSGAQPEGHLWDNGKNAAEELVRVAEVRKLALENFGLNNLAADRPYSDLQEILVPIYLFHRFQTTAAVKLIGGVDYAYQIKEGDTPLNQPVPAEMQYQALEALLATLSPEFLHIDQKIIDVIPPKAYGSYRNRESAPTKTGLIFDPIELAAASAHHTLKGMLEPARLNRVAQQAGEQLPSLDAYLSKIIEKTIESDALTGKQAIIQQRVAALVIEQLVALTTNDNAGIEVKAAALSSLFDINDWFNQQSVMPKNANSSFYKLAQHHLAWYLEHRKWLPLIKPTPLPPGSPI